MRVETPSLSKLEEVILHRVRAEVKSLRDFARFVMPRETCWMICRSRAVSSSIPLRLLAPRMGALARASSA